MYPSGVRLQRAARGLARTLGYLQREYDPQSIFMVAHSMGGLVSRSALLQSIQGEVTELDALSSVKLFVSFSTPWNGHAAATSGVKYAPAVVPAWIDMQPESDFIRSLNEDLPVPHHLFFGFDTNNSLIKLYSHDSVVSVASQLAPWAQENAVRTYGYDLNHVGILSDDAVRANFNEILREAYNSSLIL